MKSRLPWRSCASGLLFVFAVLAATALVTAATPEESEVSAALREIVQGESGPELKWRGIGPYRELLSRFYEARGYAPAWLREGRPTRPAAEAVTLLERAPEKGLSSTDYDAPLLAAKLGELDAGQPATPRELARFDTALTVALLRYTTHLAHGRVNPRSLYLDLDSDKRSVDVVALLQSGIERDQLAAILETAEPQLPLYAALKKSLAHYRRLAADPTLPLVPPAKTKLEPGSPYPELPQLERRLAAFGDLDPGVLTHDSGGRYDGEVVSAVKRFQERHGLAADGVLGTATFAELNRPLIERVRQIELGIERIRWLPAAPPERFLVINIPRFKLLAFDGAVDLERPLMAMDVIVGRAGKTPTPVFADEMEYVEFSPYWNVPRSIAVKELLPKLTRDPGYLARQGMEIVGAGGPATSVDAITLGALERGTARLRQRPGAKNALGGVKFVFPNRYDVYLHSTPTHELFSRTRRDFSHGCIRVEDPVALAQFVLFERPEWDVERIRKSMSLPEPLRVTLKRPMPILIFYTTAVVDPAGRTHFLPDIYGHDRKLAAALEKGPTQAP